MPMRKRRPDIPLRMALIEQIDPPLEKYHSPDFSCGVEPAIHYGNRQTTREKFSMLSLSTLMESGAQIPQNISQLPHYNTNIRMDLPADAAPMGVLADGNIYFDSYEMLTPNDISFLKETTGQSFDPATIAAEQAAGTFRGDPLAAAIGFDRANYIAGLGGLSGDVTSSYLQSIESAMQNPLGDHGTYEGFQVSSSELSKAFSALADQPSPAVSVSA